VKTDVKKEKERQSNRERHNTVIIRRRARLYKCQSSLDVDGSRRIYFRVQTRTSLLTSASTSKTAIVSKYTSIDLNSFFSFFPERPNADVPSLPPCRAGVHRWWLCNFLCSGAGMLTKRCARHPRTNLGCAIIDEPLSDITRLARNAVFCTEPSVHAVPSHGLYLSRSSFVLVNGERGLC
jgi:hypothetical protein